MSLKVHPDKAGGSAAAFHQVAEAFETLSDPEKRQLYDDGVDTTKKRKKKEKGPYDSESSESEDEDGNKKKSLMNSKEAESISVLEQNLARAVELQRQAAVQEQLIRQRIREGGHVEPDSLLVLTDDALRRTMGYLPPKELANVEVCRRLRSANVLVWDGLVQHKYPVCKTIDGKSSKEKILIHLHSSGPGRSFSRHMMGRPIKISGSPFATIPSMSGLNRSSSPSFSTSYNYMHAAQ